MLKMPKYYNIYRGCWIGLCVEEGWGQGGVGPFWERPLSDHILSPKDQNMQKHVM
jgi:hypothetical protein